VTIARVRAVLPAKAQEFAKSRQLAFLDDPHGVTMLVGPGLGVFAAIVQRRRSGAAAAASASEPSSIPKH
jgi:hypothetical protein